MDTTKSSDLMQNWELSSELRAALDELVLFEAAVTSRRFGNRFE